MGSIGAPEVLVILVLALLVLGPERLPQAARTAGRWMAELRKITGSLQAEVQTVVDEVMQPVQTTATATKDAFVTTAPASVAGDPATGATPSESTTGPEDAPVTSEAARVDPPFDPSMN